MINTIKASNFRYGVIFISVVFILIGMVRDEHLVVLKKASSICLECIGIG